MLSDLEPVVLRGDRIYLEPLEEQHAAELFAIGRDEAMWRYMTRGPMTSEDDARQFLRNAQINRDFGLAFQFGIRLAATGALIGSTRYQDIQPRNESVEIGWTFVHPSFWWMGAGTESQFLLAGHAFEKLGAGRVWFKTDTRNLRTQKALQRCGITREGVLRRHLLARDGFIRDSVIYSIVREEWPAVKQTAERVLARFRRSRPTLAGGR
jgi:RimJ/RimL family protein N-acetyltransferase